MEQYLKRIYTSIIVLMPILNIYSTKQIQALGVGELVGIILLIMLFILGNRERVIIRNVPYWIFISYLALNSVILTLFIPSYLFSETILRILRTLFYTCIIFGFSYRYMDIQYLEKLYLCITLVASAYLLLQYIIHLLMGIELPVVLPGMNLSNLGSSEEFAINLLRRYSYEYRPSGFFTEPAHFCHFVIYSIPMILMKQEKTIRYYAVLILNISAIIISGSAIGYVCLMGTICIWLVFSKKVQARFVILLLVGILIFISIKYGYLDKVLYRFSTINTVGTSTGTVRLLRGLIVFCELPFVYKIFGIGAGNYAAFVNSFDIVTMFDRALGRENEYMNTISMILVYGGIIGVTLYVYAIYRIVKKANKNQIMYLVILILLLFSSNIFYSATYIMPMILINYKMDKEV